MSQPNRPQKPVRKPPARETNRLSVVYIGIAMLVVFALILTALNTVNWGGLFDDKEEPTPDYGVDSIAAQQTIVAENPDDVAEHALLASMLASSGRIDEAIPEYEKALTLDPADTDVRLDFARSLQNNGKPLDAEAQFLKVLDMEPDNYTAHYYLARLYLDSFPTKRDEAIAHLEQVTEIAPDSFLAEQATTLLETLQRATPIASPLATP
ncbi:MAG: tetratricopeptide repeat protein [Thermomicrobiales bacterium]|nr:tetratricopeptide repeat protein [Thermomicrobiales bacterium]